MCTNPPRYTAAYTDFPPLVRQKIRAKERQIWSTRAAAVGAGGKGGVVSLHGITFATTAASNVGYEPHVRIWQK